MIGADRMIDLKKLMLLIMVTHLKLDESAVQRGCACPARRRRWARRAESPECYWDCKLVGAVGAGAGDQGFGGDGGECFAAWSAQCRKAESDWGDWKGPGRSPCPPGGRRDFALHWREAEDRRRGPGPGHPGPGPGGDRGDGAGRPFPVRPAWPSPPLTFRAVGRHSA